MKPILVHVHVYYDYLWDEISECIKNLSSYDYDLRVTIVNDDANLIKRIKTVFPHASIAVVPNLGFDIGPFIYVINSVDLSDYSYIIKLHTKRNILRRDSLYWFYGTKWREALLNFIKSSQNVNKVIFQMESNPKIGMHGPNIAIFNKYCDDGKAQIETSSFLRKNGLKACHYKFVAGAMFIVKSELLKKITDLKLTQEDFQYSDKSHNSCQLAHVIERFFGYTVYSQGYRVCDCTSNPIISNLILLINILRRFVFTKVISFRVTSRNKFLVKLLFVPILAIPLKKNK